MMKETHITRPRAGTFGRSNWLLRVRAWLILRLAGSTFTVVINVDHNHNSLSLNIAGPTILDGVSNLHLLAGSDASQEAIDALVSANVASSR